MTRADEVAPAGVATVDVVSTLAVLRRWSLRRWLVVVVAAVGSFLALGLPTDVIANPWFGRQGTPVEPWAYPVLLVTAALAGLLFATYVRDRGTGHALDSQTGVVDVDTPGRMGGLGGLVSFFAIGCPVCNKVVVVALGTSGALSWFAPIQPYLGLASLTLLAWALHARLRGESACPVTLGSG